MRLGLFLLSLSRPLTFVAVVGLHLAAGHPSEIVTKLYAASLTFYLISSVIVVGWIPVPSRLQTALLWSEIGLTSVLLYLTPGGAISILLSPILITIMLVLDRRQWLPAVVATVGVWVASTVPAHPSGVAVSWGWMMSFLGLYIFSTGIGILIRNLNEERERSESLLAQVRESEAALRRTMRQLQETAAIQQEAAVLEERQRITREIHDSVAHALTALLVQLQAARRTADRAPSDMAATLAQCEEMAREALRETRRAVRALRPGGLEGQDDVEVLQRMGREFGTATGIQVEVTAGDEVRRLPRDPNRLEQLCRIFQEALTNAYRHAGATRVDASLSVTGNMFRMSITNNGRPPGQLQSGVGLASMRERAGMLGGTVSFTPTETGLTVTVSIPTATQGEEAV